MKRFLSIAIAFCISIAGLSVPAAQAEDYSIPCSNGGSVPVTGTILGSATADCGGEVVIPAEVTELGQYAFAYRPAVTSVTFEPNSPVTVIPNGFLTNSGVTSFSIPSNVNRIQYGAFERSFLTSISIPGTVTLIGPNAFANSPLETVVLEPRAENISWETDNFQNTNLQSITFKSKDEINSLPYQLAPTKSGYNFQYWSSTPGGPVESFPVSDANSEDIVLFPVFTQEVVQTFDCSLGGTFTVVDEVLTESSNCAGEAIVPSVVQIIGSYSFIRSPISKIIIPATVSKISTWAFPDSEIETVEFEPGSALERIDGGAFTNCKNLTDFSLPANASYVADGAFEGSGLEHFTVEGPQAYWWFENNWLGKTQLASLTFADARGSVVFPGTPRRTGNIFEGWSDSDGGSAVEFPFSVGELTEITLYAKWAPSTFAVTYDSQGGTLVDPGQVVGGEITSAPTPPTREGFTFAGWKRYPWEPIAVFPYSPPEEGALTLYAAWNSIDVGPITVYQVTFDTQGGSWTDIANIGGIPYASFGSLQPMVSGTGPFTAVREGYTFGGWSTSANGEPISFPYAPGVSENITLYALWISDVILREVSFNSNGGSEVESASFADGGEIESAPEEPTRDGYTFEGWSDVEDGEVVSFPYTPSVTEDIVLFAKWAANVYEVIFDSNGGSAVTAGSFVTEGEIASAPTAPTRTGFIFAGWSDTDGGTAVSFPHSPGVFEDITLYAKWTAVYKITYFSTGGSSVSAGTFVNGGKLAAAPAAPKRTGYTFGGWSATNGGAVIKFPYTPGVSRNISLYAKWVSTKVKAEATVKPTVTGLAKARSILKANKGTWKGSPTPTVAYQWYLCTKAVASPQAAIPSTCKVISGKTSSSLTVTTVYKGKFLAVRVTGTSAGSTPTVWLSKSTGAVS